ncbi:6216_t:CDS:2 [Diversispora eburnea]|uniref:tRNA N(3)-methylcytidine methyltransferase n=1 Tax=Diversispora eburnea TaxID=1213867 RepID=A0A9N8V306_9GLOM|nr:6216_t:CDS:2 [Diversispora eburnea]
METNNYNDNDFSSHKIVDDTSNSYKLVDEKSVPKFWVDKYKKEASKNWDLFYKRNTTNFFKNRNWIGREFTELSFNVDDSQENSFKYVLELGCGVGNFIFPVLETNSKLFIYACDFSVRAIEFVKKHEQYNESRCHAFVCDLSNDKLKDYIPSQNIDIVSSIFVLSAIPPEHHLSVIRNVSEVTRKGAIICFRDYAQFDETQLKFASSNSQHKLQENFYVRQDGTMSYFFTLEYLREIFEVDRLFKFISGKYVARETINRAKDLRIDRKFLQAKFERL